MESPDSPTDKTAIPVCNLFSTEYNQPNKHKIILFGADCCVGTWTAPNVPATALFCFVCFLLAVLMDFTSLLLSTENMIKTIQDMWMPRWFCREIWMHNIYFWNRWSLYVFTWLHLYKTCGLLTALSRDPLRIHYRFCKGAGTLYTISVYSRHSAELLLLP